MNRTSVLFAATAVTAGAVVVTLSYGLHNEREQARILLARIAELEQSASNHKSPAAINYAPANSQQQPRATDPTRPATPNSVRSSASGGDRDFERWLRNLADPAYRAAEVAYRRGRLEESHPDLVKALHLQPALAEQLLNLLAQEELVEMERSTRVSLESIDDAAGTERKRSNEEYRKQVAAERVALLGEVGAQQLDAYFQSSGTRRELRQLRMNLADSGIALPDDQIQPLIESLAVEQQRFLAERGSLFSAIVNGRATQGQQEQLQLLLKEHLERKRLIAGSYLDPRQMAGFNAMLDQQLRRARVDLKSSRVFSKIEQRETGNAGQ